MKKVVIKSLQTIMLVSILETSLMANDIQALSNTLWKGSFQNSCTESFTFNPASSTFTIISSFGKKMIGYYTVENQSNSERFKITFQIKIDNGLKDCASQTYNSTNQVMVNYLWLSKNRKLLNISTQKKGNVFTTYSYIESYSSDALTLAQVYIIQMAVNETKQLKSTSSSMMTFAQEMRNREKKEREESIAFNKMIMEEVRKSKANDAKIINSNSHDKSWKNQLTAEQLVAQQNLENRLDSERRAQRNEDYLQESYRNEEIQQGYIQESYIQEQINQDYNNGY